MTKTKIRLPQYTFVIIALIFLVLAVKIISRSLYQAHSTVHIVTAQNQTQTFTAKDLKKYDGTDPSLPIYIAMNSLVYDVTAGKEFYQTGGSYHYLAGRDSSNELNFIGGGIIKAKYPVIGQFVISN